MHSCLFHQNVGKFKFLVLVVDIVGRHWTVRLGMTLHYDVKESDVRVQWMGMKRASPSGRSDDTQIEWIMEAQRIGTAGSVSNSGR